MNPLAFMDKDASPQKGNNLFVNWYKKASGDDLYLRVVEQGDMTTAQHLVEETAKAKGFGVGPVWHGSPHSGFTSFQIPTHGFNSNVFGSYDVSRNAVFFTDNQDAAKGYQTQGGRTSGETRMFYLEGSPSDYVDMRKGISGALWNTLVGGGVNERWLSQHHGSWELFDREQDPEGILVQQLKKLNYAGVIIHDTDGTSDFDSFVVFEPSSIKLADPVTYDNGKPIPLSERFDYGKNDIRY